MEPRDGPSPSPGGPEAADGAAAAAEEAPPESPPYFLLYPGRRAAAPPGLPPQSVWSPPGGAALPVLLLSSPGPAAGQDRAAPRLNPRGSVASGRKELAVSGESLLHGCGEITPKPF